MRMLLAGVMVLGLAWPAMACDKPNMLDCPLTEGPTRREIEHRETMRQFDRDYSDYLADNRARDTNAAIRDLTREVEALRRR